MAVEVSTQEEVSDDILSRDPRWLLVQRILASDGFQRAGQLRKILLYVSKAAILRPEQILREYEIACDVLERRRDFDPTSDNIVRAQFTHLRHKLERYFNHEGKDEPFLLTIPKGSYRPVFARLEIPIASPLPALIRKPLPDANDESTVENFLPDGPPSRQLQWRSWHRAAIAVGLTTLVVIATVFVHTQVLMHTKPDSDVHRANAFIQFLSRYDGNVSVVVPDLSETIIRLVSGKEVSVVDYASGDFSHKQISSVGDPAVRDVLSKLAKRRITTITEASVAFDFMDTLRRADIHSTVRYARDLHARDLNEGSAILIGSQNSNPWIARFLEKPNFRFIQDNDIYYYENISPQAGEQRRYEITYATPSHDAVSYADVTFIPNASQTGYILLIIGSDSESNEAAVRFLLHGTLPPEITSLLARKDLRSFELFLRGKHTAGEANDSLELVSLRPR